MANALQCVDCGGRRWSDLLEHVEAVGLFTSLAGRIILARCTTCNAATVHHHVTPDGAVLDPAPEEPSDGAFHFGDQFGGIVLVSPSYLPDNPGWRTLANKLTVDLG